MAQGMRIGPLFRKASAVLERHRLVTINKSTQVAAYAGCGSVPEGYTHERGRADAVSVERLDTLDRTFMLTIDNTVAIGDAIVPVTDGKGRAKDYTVINRITASAPGGPSNGDKYLVPAAGWGGAHANAIASYTTDWTYVDMDGDTADTVIYDSKDKMYYTWNGTAWVASKVACYSNAVGTAGDDVECLKTSIVPTDVVGKIVACGFSASETDANAEVVISDSRIQAGDYGFAQVAAGANAVYVLRAVVTANTLTVTLSGNGGAGTILSYLVARPNA